MATSGITTFTMSRDELINAALRKFVAVADGQAVTSTQLTNGSQALNAMLKAFQTKGMPIWAISETDFSLTSSASYTFGLGQTENIPAPLKVIQAILKDSDGNRILPMNVINHYDFNLLPTNSTGTPVSLWYQPLNQTGIAHVWPTPDADSIANKHITIAYQRPFEDMVNGTDTVDFPQFWLEAIIYGLASRLAPEFGVPLQDRQLLNSEAKEYLDDALSFGTEEGSLFIKPDWVGRS